MIAPPKFIEVNENKIKDHVHRSVIATSLPFPEILKFPKIKTEENKKKR